jgi:molybdate transport system regulatory protein
MQTEVPARARLRMEPRLKVWVESDQGRIVLSDYRVRLLEAVAASGSLAEAASQMGLSYRRAWGKIREIETNLGFKLVESVVGGSGGGSSRLTGDGERLVRQFRDFRRSITREAARQFAASFEGGPA